MGAKVSSLTVGYVVVGEWDGNVVGPSEGALEGCSEGSADGETVGVEDDGAKVGDIVGECVNWLMPPTIGPSMLKSPTE